MTYDGSKLTPSVYVYKALTNAMDDPFAVLRIPSFTVRKESDLPKLKERAKNLVKQYEKVNKFDKAREVEVAYRSVKEMVIKRANCAGSKAFNKVMVNRPAKSSSEKVPEKSGEKSGPKNPAEVHFLKAQGARGTASAGTAAASEKPVPAPSQPCKSREERLKEKLEARRAAASEKDKRAAAIKEKLAAKRAKKNGDALPSASSPVESMPSLENMASPDSSGVEADADHRKEAGAGTDEHSHNASPDQNPHPQGPDGDDGPNMPEEDMAVDFF